MIKVMFMNPDGDNLDSRDMSLEQLHALKFVDKVDVGADSYTITDMAYNVNIEELYVWLK